MRTRSFDNLADRCFDRAGYSDGALGKEQAHFPQADRSNCAPTLDLCVTNFAHRGSREFAGSRNRPQQNVRIQQDHFSPSQSSMGVTGETMSPRISIFPARHPKILEGLSSGGTSLASGFPRLVISTGVRLVRTSSMTCKHRALNSPAAIVFIMVTS